jgi:hypothetical protein
MIERGSFNYRWPFHEYLLLRNGTAEENSTSDVVLGTYSVLSIVKDGVCYQVLRLEVDSWDKDTELNQRVALTVGGDLWFQKFADAAKRREDALTGDSECDTKRQEKAGQVEGVEGGEYGPRNEVSVTDETRSMIMEYNVCYINPSDGKEERLPLVKSDECVDSRGKVGRPAAYNAWRDCTKRELEEGVVFVAAFKLRHRTDTPNANQNIESSAIYEHVVYDPHEETFDAARHGACATSEDPGGRESDTSSAAGKYRVVAPGNIWETAFLRRGETGAGIVGLLSEANMVGRCVAKIMDVEMCPTTVPAPRTSTSWALVSNLFVHPNVDLKALL